MNEGHAAADHPALPDLIEPRRWQRLQDHFANVLGVTLRTVSPSRQLLLAPSWPPTLAPDQVVELLSVGQELEPLLPIQDPPQDISSITTVHGVTYAAVPVRSNADQVVAYFIVGPMVVGPREDKTLLRQRVEKTGVDVQALWNLILSLRPYSFSGIRSLLNLLEEVGTSLVQFAFQASQLANLLPASAKVDQAVVSYYTDRVLNSLLEVAAMATRAEGGSVMLYDPETDSMRIRAAHGLSDAIVAETRQKRGDGLAGLAASKRSILLVDDQSQQDGLRPLMHRKELVSSLVAPVTLEPAQEPIGVLNLRTSNRERRFTPEHVEMIRRLLDLTSIALGNLHFAFTTKPQS